MFVGDFNFRNLSSENQVTKSMIEEHISLNDSSIEGEHDVPRELEPTLNTSHGEEESVPDSEAQNSTAATVFTSVRGVGTSEEERIYQLKLEIERLALETQVQEKKLGVLNPKLVLSDQEEQNRNNSYTEERGGEDDGDREVWVDAETAFRMRVESAMRKYFSQQPPLDESNLPQPLSQLELAELIEEYEERRRQLEEEGYYLEAQQVMNKIKEVNLIETQKMEQVMARKQQRLKKDLKKKQEVEMKVFGEIWSEKMEEYEKRAKEVVLATVERHKWEITELEKVLRSSAYLKKPKFSKEVLNMKNMLQKLVKQKMYEEADDLRRNLKPFELKDLADFQKLVESQIQQKMNIVKNQQSQEVEAIKQRILKGKTELINNRKNDQRRLEQQHHNILQDFEMKKRRVITKTKDYLGKQSSVLLSSPRKSSLDFSVLSFGNSTFDRLSEQLQGCKNVRSNSQRLFIS